MIGISSPGTNKNGLARSDDSQRCIPDPYDIPGNVNLTAIIRRRKIQRLADHQRLILVPNMYCTPGTGLDHTRDTPAIGKAKLVGNAAAGDILYTAKERLAVQRTGISSSDHPLVAAVAALDLVITGTTVHQLTDQSRSRHHDKGIR